MKNLYSILLVVILLNMAYSGDVVKIKFATVAPEGSTWLNLMQEFNQAVQEATDGQVKFQIYAGMVQGDEKVILQKFRHNQLHSGGFTGVGLGIVLPEVRILDSPFLFRNHDEIDYINDKFFDRFAKKFEEKAIISGNLSIKTLLGITCIAFSEVNWHIDIDTTSILEIY